MTPAEAGGPPVRPAGDRSSRVLPAPLALMLATAQREIDRHTADHGRCTACGQPYPCQRATLADLALSGL
jgi:hypothetical protein